MILVRSPLRITLGGGGTDLPAYANEHGGVCLTAAITQYVYVSVIRPFEPGIYLKYSALEHVQFVKDVQHPIMREALRVLKVDPHIEITTLADVPSGTGLGSSGSFTTALLRALGVFFHDGDRSSQREIARLACYVEIDCLQAPIGPQDPYAAAYGGLQQLTVTDRGVAVDRLSLSVQHREALCDRLVLYFTGYTRETNATITGHSFEALHDIKAIGQQSATALEAGDWTAFGELLHAHWQAKQKRSPRMSNPQIDAWYALGRRHGALGGKLVGAGGGGCLLFLTHDPQRLRAGLADSGLKEIRFRFDTEGTKVLQT